MKLAWKELKHDKTRYIMVEAILVLMVFMVLFLTGLANGLGRAVSAGIENADATYFAVGEDSENLITISNIEKETVNKIYEQAAGKTAVLDIQRMNLTKEGSDKKLDVTYFAIEKESMLSPVITEGVDLKDSKEKNGIILDDSFQAEDIKLGDVVVDAASGLKMKVIGFTHDAYYGHSSIGYITTKTYTSIRTELNPNYEQAYHAVAIQGNDVKDINIDGVSIVDKATIIENIPGYKAEQTTINMIIWVLVVISASVLGVFFYVITIQKQKQYGVLKAIGMKTSEIAGMIIFEVVLLACFGMCIGNLLVWGMSMMLPASMPFYLKANSVVVVSVAFVVISVVSSLISARKVAKVDPIVTIGGNE